MNNVIVTYEHINALKSRPKDNYPYAVNIMQVKITIRHSHKTS